MFKFILLGDLYGSLDLFLVKRNSIYYQAQFLFVTY